MTLFSDLINVINITDINGHKSSANSLYAQFAHIKVVLANKRKHSGVAYEILRYYERLATITFCAFWIDRLWRRFGCLIVNHITGRL